jgi:hypothetical protein
MYSESARGSAFAGAAAAEELVVSARGSGSSFLVFLVGLSVLGLGLVVCSFRGKSDVSTVNYEV